MKKIKERLDIINNPEKYNLFGDVEISEKEFYKSIEEYIGKVYC